MRLRELLYLNALGFLNLRYADLWDITNGELCDLLLANEYRLFRERQEQAMHTAAMLNIWSKNKISVQDLTGFWYNGRIYDKNEFLDERLGVRS